MIFTCSTRIVLKLCFKCIDGVTIRSKYFQSKLLSLANLNQCEYAFCIYRFRFIIETILEHTKNNSMSVLQVLFQLWPILELHCTPLHNTPVVGNTNSSSHQCSHIKIQIAGICLIILSIGHMLQFKLLAYTVFKQNVIQHPLFLKWSQQ